MIYRRRASPLHAARASAACAYCLALVIAALVISNPVVLGAVTVAVALAGAAAGVGRELRRAALLAIPLGIAVAVINALVTRDGLTVIARLGHLPLLGRADVTLEATAYGGILGLRAATLVLCAALYTAAVDPDEVLKLFRRVSFRSALTATLATRMVPLLARDARRLADAQRCRAGRSPTRIQLVRVATTGMLERALDVAAALEIRGYGAARRSPPSLRPLSRHDIAFLASAVAVVGLTVAARIADLAPFRAYPSLHAPVGASTLALAGALLLAALAPFADRRGVER
jgi:energy-coupling factor transport system permease protein